mgnify:CR=1 FL=1
MPPMEETLPLLHLLLEHFRHLAEVIPEEETLAEEEELRQPIQEVLLLLQPRPPLRRLLWQLCQRRSTAPPQCCEKSCSW